MRRYRGERVRRKRAVAEAEAGAGAGTGNGMGNGNGGVRDVEMSERSKSAVAREDGKNGTGKDGDDDGESVWEHVGLKG